MNDSSREPAEATTPGEDPSRAEGIARQEGIARHETRPDGSHPVDPLTPPPTAESMADVIPAAEHDSPHSHAAAVAIEGDASGEAEAAAAEREGADASGNQVEGEIHEPTAAAEDVASPQETRAAPKKGAKRKKAAEPPPEDTAAAETNGETPPAEDTGPKSEKMDWYILKVQSNREDSIRDALMRRVKVAGLDEYFDEVIVPTETISEYKDGKRRTRKQKLWPGYLVVHMEINEESWFLVRETPGIGDFTGAGGKPTPMLATEVEKVLRLAHPERHVAKEKAPVKIAFEMGDRVKIKEGTFQNFDGEVCGIDHANGRVTVMTEIFSRKTPVEFDYWQIERV